MAENPETAQPIQCVVLFADIAESTRLYDRLGDQQAQEVVSRCLATMAQIVGHHGGRVVKTVGDEIMCRFPSPDAAVQAACQINETLDRGVDGLPALAVRIGLHYGPVIEDRDDVYGDSVNLAARMVSVAKAQQIITTQETVAALSADVARLTRIYDRATVKGKQGKVTIYEVLWDVRDLTAIMSVTAVTRNLAAKQLRLRYGGREALVSADTRLFVLGRGLHCDLVVQSRLASRIHAKIEYHRGKFVLIDQSTNGTFVRTQDGKEVYLRREGLPLWGKGTISLGQSVADEAPHLIEYLSE
jgi:class 3 adenylate cyclase